MILQPARLFHTTDSREAIVSSGELRGKKDDQNSKNKTLPPKVWSSAVSGTSLCCNHGKDSIEITHSMLMQISPEWETFRCPDDVYSGIYHTFTNLVCFAANDPKILFWRDKLQPVQYNDEVQFYIKSGGFRFCNRIPSHCHVAIVGDIPYEEASQEGQADHEQQQHAENLPNFQEWTPFESKDNSKAESENKNNTKELQPSKLRSKQKLQGREQSRSKEENEQKRQSTSKNKSQGSYKGKGSALASSSSSSSSTLSLLLDTPLSSRKGKPENERKHENESESESESESENENESELQSTGKRNSKTESNGKGKSESENAGKNDE